MNISSSTQLIAVYGSSGSGKTLIAQALGNALTAKGKKVVAMSMDCCSPALAVWLPNMKPRAGIGDSLGSLLQYASINLRDVAERIHTHPSNHNLGFMGCAYGASPSAYDGVSDERVMDMFELLVSETDIIIVDCQTNPVADALSRVGLSNADTAVCLFTADIKGLAWVKAMEMQGIDTTTHIRVASAVTVDTPMREFSLSCGRLDAVLPYSLEVATRFAAGELVGNNRKQRGRMFDAAIQQLAARVRR